MPTKVPQALSEGEETLVLHLRNAGIAYRRHFRFAPKRQWKADFIIGFKANNTALLVEVEGGVYTQGRHSRGKGYENDIMKYNEAALLGFKVLRFSTGQVKSGYAIDTIRRAVK